MPGRETVFGNRALTHFDALVIGSGPSGSAATALLCRHGKKVLLVEAGPNYYLGIDSPKPGMPIAQHGNDELRYARGLLDLPASISPRSYRRSPADGDRTQVGTIMDLPRGVGGGSALADGRVPRFAPQDFLFGSLLGPRLPDASYVDWPVSYDQLEPFYRYAELSVGVQGEPDPHGGPRSSPYPMEPGPAKYVSLLLAEAARKQGYQPFRCPRALNSRRYRGRPACVNCGFCAGFGCPSNARGGSTAVSLLHEALLGGNCLLLAETRVRRLLVSGDGRQVVGVEVVSPDGSRQTLRADTYILSTGPIEDARLVLYSENSATLNPHDLVGRNFCGRSVTVAVGIFDYRIHQDRGNGASFSMTDLRGDARDPSRPIGGLMTLGGEQTTLLETGLYLGTLRVPPGSLLKKALRQSIGRERMAYLSMYVEDPPQLSNRIDLDPALRDHDGVPAARITYQRHPYAVAASAYFGPKQLDILQAAGAQYGAALPLEDAQAQCGHHGGTLRFGRSPRDSVCTPEGRFHELDNLFGSGGSLFCSLPGYNPTLTMSALGLWVAANLVSPGSPERAVQDPPTP